METDRSIPDLTKDLAGQFSQLLRNEVRLARTEALDNVKQLGGGVIRVGVGIAVASAALTLGLIAFAYALAEMMPLWGGALVAALVGGAIAYTLIRSGRNALSAESMAMPRTKEQFSRDISLIKEKVSS